MTAHASASSIASSPAPRDAPPLLLLHGTGGDENDLLPLGRTSRRARRCCRRAARCWRTACRASSAASRRASSTRPTCAAGRGSRRFRRGAASAYGLAAPLALGFSNGANIAAAMLLLRPDVLAGAVLLRPMVPFAEPPPCRPLGQAVLMLSGAMDPIVPAETRRASRGSSRGSGAAVDHRVLPTGHGLSQADVSLAVAWAERSVAIPA